MPDNKLAAKLFKEFFDLPQEIKEEKQQGFKTRNNFLEHFQWDKSGRVWESYFDTVSKTISETWMSPVDIQRPDPMPEELPPNVRHSELARWLITNVLKEPSKIDSFMEARLVRDLLYECSTATTGGMYYNEMSTGFDGRNTRQQFGIKEAYNNMAALRNRKKLLGTKKSGGFWIKMKVLFIGHYREGGGWAKASIDFIQHQIL